MQPAGMMLTAPEGTRWRFDAGSLFLEFLLTGGPGELARYAAVHTPPDLGRWAHTSRLGLDPEQVTTSTRDIAVAGALRDALCSPGDDLTG